MKNIFLTAACLLLVSSPAFAAKQTLTSSDTGAQSRTKLNANFTELYDGKSDKATVVRYWTDWPTTAPNNVLAVNTIVGYEGKFYKVTQELTKTGSTADPETLTAYFSEIGKVTAADLGLGTSDNPSFNSVHASGGNLAAANAQVTKKWITGLSYTADVTSVIHGGQHYIATSNHTAGASTEPGVGASWENVWKIASGSGGSDYTLPAATASVLGGVKTGTRVSIQADGTLSADEQYVSNCTGGPCLDGSSDGGSEIALFGGGTYWTKLQSGTLSASRTWKLPTAAPPSAGTTRLVNMDENGQMGFVDPATFAAANNVLALNNTTSFTPDADHEPATKKYVDDAVIAGGGYTDEMAQDAVGGMFTGNTETGIAITYDDATAKVNAVVDFSGLASVYQPLDPDLTTAAGAGAASNSTWFGKNSSGTVGFHTFPTDGTAGSLSISGQTGLLTFTGLTSTNRAKTVRNAADTILELGGSYTPTGTWNWQSASVTWPTFNQATTKTAGGLSGTPNITVGTVSAGGGGFTVDPDGDTVAKTIQAESFTSIAADGARRSVLPNNTVPMAPTGGGVVEIYNEAGAIKAVESNTEYDVLLSRDIGVASGVQAYNQYLPTWPSTVDATEVGYLNGVTSAIQGQIDGKQASDADLTTAAGANTAGNSKYFGTNASGTPGYYDLPTGSGTPTTITVADTTDTTSYVALFESATGDLGPKTDAAITYNAGTGAMGVTSIELGHASDTTLARNAAGVLQVEGVVIPTISSTNTLTNKTLDVEGTGNSITIVDKVWFAAAGCNNTTATSFYDLPTSNPAAAACITGTNTQKGVLDFDAATDESGQVTLALPSDFVGAIDVKYKWLAAATSGNVVWGVQTSCVADAETDDPSWNTASTTTDAAKGTTLQTNDASMTGVTATGCSAGELLHLRFFRDADNGSDTMTGDARLIGAEVTLRRAQ